MATEVIYTQTRRKYRWPEVQLNLWIFVILAAASTNLGIFAWFMTVQQQLQVGIPWYVELDSRKQCLETDYYQALPIRCCHFSADPDLPPPHPHTRCASTPHTGHHPARILHTVCPVAHHPH